MKTRAAQTNQKHTLSARRTSDGLIEVTSLEMLDALVGGLIAPEDAYCQLNNIEDSSLSFSSNQEGVN